MKNKKTKKIHFVGIGGVSMFSLAIYALKKGYTVTGSDLSSNSNVKMLKKMGVKVFKNHSPSNIEGADLIVFSSATRNSPEVIYALKNKYLVLSRAEFLAKLLAEYNFNICVAGAHGKTTTTAMIYNILITANYPAGLHLGANLAKSGKSYDYSNKFENLNISSKIYKLSCAFKQSSKQIFLIPPKTHTRIKKTQNKPDCIVCEACEYMDSFLKLSPDLAVILNIAPEHLDYFKNYSNVKKSFNAFASKAKTVVINEEFKNDIKCKNICTFGLNLGDFTAQNIKTLKNGKVTFDCYKNNVFYAHITLGIPLYHNVLNALASICVCDLLKIDKKYICAGLHNFCGVERRFERLSDNHFFIHDYAHHPSEIKTTLKEAKKLTNNKLLVVFQPHTYSRTKTLLKDFLTAFDDADEIIITKTYSARERYDYWGSGKYLAKMLGSHYMPKKRELEGFILDKIAGGYGCLILGAGDIYDFAKKVAKKLGKS